MLSQGNAFSVRQDLTPRTVLVGVEREPVLVVEDAAADPQGLIDCAVRDAGFATPKGGRNFYPGLLAPAPLPYVEALARALDPHVRRAFALEGVGLANASCNFSLATLPPDRLNLAQRLPHVDTVDPLQFAVLHYLCDEAFGGTGFYRHRATGFESLGEDRLETYQRTLDDEVAATPPAAAYVGDDSPLFEQTARFEAVFNRVIVYRSRVLHSGQIPPTASLSPDPRRGRLTANIFLNYRPRRS